MIKILLERGADPLIANEVEMSALDSAVRTRDVEICILLLEEQRVKNYLSQGNLKPLFIACHDGKREVCELFLRYGADLTRPGFRGSTPLHTAAFQGHEDVCELFIETGNITYMKMKVDFMVKKKKRKTPKIPPPLPPCTSLSKYKPPKFVTQKTFRERQIAPPNISPPGACTWKLSSNTK